MSEEVTALITAKDLARIMATAAAKAMGLNLDATMKFVQAELPNYMLAAETFIEARSKGLL